MFKLENLFKIKVYEVTNFIPSDQTSIKNYYSTSMYLDIPHDKILSVQAVDAGFCVLETVRISEANILYVETVSSLKDPSRLVIKVKVVYIN